MERFVHHDIYTAGLWSLFSEQRLGIASRRANSATFTKKSQGGLILPLHLESLQGVLRILEQVSPL